MFIQYICIVLVLDIFIASELERASSYQYIGASRAFS